MPDTPSDSPLAAGVSQCSLVARRSSASFGAASGMPPVSGPKFIMASNPYRSPKEPDFPKGQARAVTPSLPFGTISLICGGLTAIFGLASMWASSFLAHDDFDFFFMIYLGGSCLVWPIALCAVVFGLIAGSRGCGWKQPVVAIVLSCLGIVMIVLEWGR